MKPKTQLQHLVYSLSQKLPKITENQLKYSSEKSFLAWGVISRNKIHCLDCTHVWKNESNDKNFKEVKCPNCRKKLKMFGHNQVHFKETEYYGVLTKKQNFQVVRIICSSKHMKKNELPRYSHLEVVQHWINVDGEITTMSRSTNPFGGYYDSWIYSELEIRPKQFQTTSQIFYINPYKVYPTKQIQPIIQRNGFKGKFHGVAPHILLSSIIKDRFAENLLKTNQFSSLNYYLNKSSIDVEKYANTLKICTRNNYVVKDFSIYKDYLDLLKFFNKDINSPKYICPADLHKAHDKLVAKKAEIDRRKKLEDMKKEIQKSQKKYLKDKKAFFGLQFSDGKISIKVIEHVKDFLAEGDELGHCVFRNEYYKKANSLVLSATIGEKRIETIEISLSNMSISQARGLKNKSTEYHDKIIEMVTQNLPKINKIYQKNIKQVA